MLIRSGKFLNFSRSTVSPDKRSNFVHVLGSNHPILALIKMQFPIRWHRGVGQHSAAAVKGPRVAVAAGGENLKTKMAPVSANTANIISAGIQRMELTTYHIDVRLAAGLLKLEGHNG
jgi:hypothetical protein